VRGKSELLSKDHIAIVANGEAASNGTDKVGQLTIIVEVQIMGRYGKAIF
jgi:hypothetical protein